MAARLLALAAVPLLLVACGGGSGGTGITVAAARTYKIVNFRPSGPVPAGKPVKISFEIQQPDGKPMTTFKMGPGPHTGVHMIFVRDDLADIVHRHPPLDGSGTIRDTVTFPAPGPYRLVLDVYPATSPEGAFNFQLFGEVKVSGAYRRQPLPPPGSTSTAGGYRFTLTGASHLKAVQAHIVRVTVSDPSGKPAVFEPWYGALAHAVFFHAVTLDYFHTHVCAPGAGGCTSVLGSSKVVGTSTKPGKLDVGVLLPLPGTWRLFLQCQVNGRVLTAPFTLKVS